MLTAMVIGIFHETHLWIKYAKELGYKIIATHPVAITKKPYYDTVKDCIDQFYKVSYFDFQKLVDIAKKHNVSMLVCHPTSNDANIANGYVNSALNLKGVSYKSTLQVCSKDNFYQLLIANDLPRPKFNIKYSVDMDYDALTYPCIVKPNYGAGSIGVKLIYNKDELRNFFDYPNAKNGYNLQKPKYDYYLIEEYVEGPKIMGVQAVVYNGELTIFEKTYRDLTKEKEVRPYFYGMEFVTSREDITPYTYTQIKKLIRAIDLNNTSFNLEILLDENNDAKLFIELNLRPSTKPFNYINGYDSYKHCIQEQVKLGTKLICDFSEKKNSQDRYIGVKYFKFKPGKIKTISWPELPSNTLFFDTELTNNSIIDEQWDVVIANINGSIILMDSSRETILETFDNFMAGIKIEYY